MLKQIEVALTRTKPDLFIFESEAMRAYAVGGRGIRRQHTCVIPTGVDTERFRPDQRARIHVEREFSIPTDKKVAFYSGHMEERKGVSVIVDPAIELVDNRGLDHLFFLGCGNRPGEDACFLETLAGTRAANNVIFAGYRTHLDHIMPGCDVGLIASTGWDSFPMSSLEMASCGLPQVVSRLQGLVETIENGKTGFLFEPGNCVELADMIVKLDTDERLAKQFSLAARNRILGGYTLMHQMDNLTCQLAAVMKR